ncbi:MAG: hypothetical protein AAGF15_04145 [Pseudomonadota bacterium]
MSRSPKPYFIGFLPMPTRLKWLTAPIVVLVFVLSFGAGLMIASGMRDAGTGRWEYGIDTTLTGRLITSPYPMLETAGPMPETVLLVGVGKVGAQDWVEPLAGQIVSAKGYLIERGPWRMLELQSADDIMAEPRETAVAPPFETVAVGPAKLKGEIIDSKCFLGVMKPGEGRVHKSCAMLCVLGGMPPMLMVRDAAGARAAYLLTDESGQPVKNGVIPYIADPIELLGVVQRRGDIAVFAANIASLRRLSGKELVAFGPRIAAVGDDGLCIHPG